MPTMKEVFANLLGEDVIEEAQEESREYLYNVFSKSFPEFKYRVTNACNRLFGHSWKEELSEAGKTDMDKEIRKFWDNFYTDWETVTQISGWYDLFQEDPEQVDYVIESGGTPNNVAVDVNKEGTGEYGYGYEKVDRTARPLGLKKGTKDQLAYTKEELQPKAGPSMAKKPPKKG